MRFDIFQKKREQAEDLGVIKVYRTDNPPCAMVFKPKAIKPYKNYRFQTIEQREKYIEEQIQSHKAWKVQKDQWKGERKGTPEMLEKANPGAIFHNSWGWEQTNCDFYQVIERKCQMVKIRRISGHMVEGSGYSHGMACTKVAVKDAFLEDEPILTKKVYFYSGVPHLSMKFGSCGLWDGKPQYCSWYA